MSANVGPLVTAQDLMNLIAEADVRVVDLRQDPADAAPRVPGSVWAGLHDGFAMEREDRALHYDLPSPEEVAAALGRAGVTQDTTVIVADDMGNRWATRAYWVLRYYRHPGGVAVLDGGAAAWAAAGGEAAAGFAPVVAAEYPAPGTRDERIRITAAELREALAVGRVQACDVRTAQEYSGEVAMSGRGGHLPGASHVPWDACLDSDRRFLPAARLEEALAPFLADPREPVPYCQGGIRASLTWFCLNELLGRPARLYAASWEEWAQDHSLPVEV